MAHVVVIGGGPGGVISAQELLKAAPTSKITLFSTCRDVYWNIGAPRILTRPEEAPLEKFLFPIESFFTKHDPARFSFVQATVSSIDTAAKTVTAAPKNGQSQEVSYDYLVIASGSHSPAVAGKIALAFNQPPDDMLSEKMTHARQTMLAAQRIIVGGGGPLGIEIASEIAEVHPSKSVVLVAGSSRLLASLPMPSASSYAATQLEALGVEIIYGLKIKDVKEDTVTNKYTVTLSNDEKLEGDLFIPAMGCAPNNTFLPQNLLDESGWLKVDDSLKVEGVNDVYALGDIINRKTKKTMHIDGQAAVLTANLASDINGSGTRKIYATPKEDLMIVPIGKSGGSGQLKFFVPWGWMVAKIKGHDYFMSQARGKMQK